MWCSRRALVFAAAGLALAGCGFAPLYGNKEYGKDAAAQFAEVRINTIPDRNGQILHNLLLDRMNPSGQSANARYVLDIRLTESRISLGILKDSTATRAQLQSIAQYRIVDLKTNASLQDGTSRAIVSFNIVESNFATLASEKDARERSLREIADELTAKIAVLLTSRAS